MRCCGSVTVKMVAEWRFEIVNWDERLSTVTRRVGGRDARKRGCGGQGQVQYGSGNLIGCELVRDQAEREREQEAPWSRDSQRRSRVVASVYKVQIQSGPII